MNAERKKMAALYALAQNAGKEMPEKMLELWLDLLKSYTSDQVTRGVRRVIENYEYKAIPPFAVLKKAMDAEKPSPELLAAGEWAKTLADIAAYGPYAEPTHHPTTAFVLRIMGGWQAACMWETTHLDFKRRDFLDLWRQADGKAEILALGAPKDCAALETPSRQAPVHIAIVMKQAIVPKNHHDADEMPGR